ncbi:MAG: hypothetical protein IV103_16605, partial [Zoogloea sp.]|nr:hypothetical protein [Zoogloea sp.]
ILESGGQLIAAKPGNGGAITFLENAQRQHLQETCPLIPPKSGTQAP